MTDTRKIKGPLQILFIIFILIQPFLDVVTSLQTRQEVSLTLGVIIRPLFMIGLTIFVFIFIKNSSRIIWACKIYLVLLSLYCIFFCVMSLLTGGISGFFENTKAVVKVFYLPYMLVVCYLLYKQLDVSIPPFILSITVFQYVAVIFLSFLTDTSFKSYSLGESGYNGWFYAANEIGAIICVLSPVAIYYLIAALSEKTKTISFYIFGTATLLLISFVASFMGTRVPFYGVTAFVVLYTVWNIVFSFFGGQEGKKRYQRQFLISLGMLICIVALYFVSPLQTNQENKEIKYQMSFNTSTSSMESSSTSTTSSATESLTPEVDSEEDSSKTYELLNFILNNRIKLLEPVADEYFEGTIGEKLFGIGYVDMTGENPQMETAVEMDFIAVLLRHGVVGFFLHMIPIVIFVLSALAPIFTKFKRAVSSVAYCSMLYSVFIGLGIAFFAGHVLVAPAVSIYIAVVLVLLEKEKNTFTLKGKDNVETHPNHGRK